MTDSAGTTTARLMRLMTGDEKHDAAATSTLDVIWVLYDRVLDVSPEHGRRPGPRPVLLSKGHGPMAYYAVLAAKGFFPEAWLPAGRGTTRRSGYHPDRTWSRASRSPRGSLGHGLPLAVGTALGLRAQGIESRVVVLVGDAELDEGSNHEALELAAALGARRADRRGDRQPVDAATPSRPDRAAVRASRAGTPSGVDGRDHDALEKALSHRSVGRPNVVVAPRWRTHDEHRPATARSPATAADLVETDLSVALVYAEISGAVLRRGRAPPPRPGDQRRHPRAAARQRRRRAGAHRDAPDRAHVRLVPGRAGLRADQARLRPPGRRRSPGRARLGSFDSAGRGRTHQATGDVALMDTLSGVHIHAPSTPPRSTPCCGAPSRATGCTTSASSARPNSRVLPGRRLPRRTPRGRRHRRRARAGAGRRPGGDRGARRHGALRPHRPALRRAAACGPSSALPTSSWSSPGWPGPPRDVVADALARRTAPAAVARGRREPSCAATAPRPTTSAPTASTPPASAARWTASWRPRPDDRSIGGSNEHVAALRYAGARPV